MFSEYRFVEVSNSMTFRPPQIHSLFFPASDFEKNSKFSKPNHFYVVSNRVEVKRIFRFYRNMDDEYTYGSSRVDFYLECGGGRRVFIEVKGCTLEIDGIGYFPDAPTERGVKHLHELVKAVGDGYECVIAFVIAMPGISRVLPNRVTHPGFGDALDEAVGAGVKILCLSCSVAPGELAIVPPNS